MHRAGGAFGCVGLKTVEKGPAGRLRLAGPRIKFHLVAAYAALGPHMSLIRLQPQLQLMGSKLQLMGSPTLS